MFRYCLEKQHSEVTHIRKISWKQITVANNLDELIGIAKSNEGSFRVIDYENMCKVVFEN
jgi:chemotaxis signal transduction protein